MSRGSSSLQHKSLGKLTYKELRVLRKKDVVELFAWSGKLSKRGTADCFKAGDRGV